jgi:glycosyltransferase involved in cell wall biosynthesis
MTGKIQFRFSFGTMKKKKVVFLYTELAAYTVSCLKELSAAGCEIMLFRYPVNNEAPFDFADLDTFYIHDRKSLSFDEMLRKITGFRPDVVFCSGWIDKDYVKICGIFKKQKVKTVLCLDNQWKPSLKKLLAVAASPLFIKPNFDYAWVPGKSQKKFAMKLGIKTEDIYEGFYCADTAFWNDLYNETLPVKKEKMPHRFLYIGRYYEFKGLTELWEAFAAFSPEFPGWELWCVGTGTLAPAQHPKIKHFGFVQPAQLAPIIQQASVFVLPSRFEPWGVVVHEMAAAGFPLVLSDEVGAADAFLKENENGIVFKSGNAGELKEALVKIAVTSDSRLLEMAEKSHDLAQVITLKGWSHTVLEIINKLN